jgi:hypothetical protein
MKNLEQLFEPAPQHVKRWPAPFPTWRAELEAVRTGRKGMSIVPLEADQLMTHGRDLLRLSANRELAVVLCDSNIYVAKPDQLWRIPAMLALFETAFEGGAWSASAEAQQGLLLGYTRRQRLDWRDALDRRQIGWSVATAYTIVTSPQRLALAALGNRSFDPSERYRLFWCRFTHDVKPDAWKKQAGLARIGLAWPPVRKLFRGKRRIIEVEMTGRAINRALRTGIQFLTRNGWK